MSLQYQSMQKDLFLLLFLKKPSAILGRVQIIFIFPQKKHVELLPHAAMPQLGENVGKRLSLEHHLLVERARKRCVFLFLFF